MVLMLKSQKTMYAVLIVFLMIASLGGLGMAQEDESIRVVDVVGSGSIQGDDMAVARSQAISNALVSAVASVTTGLRPLNQQVDKFALFNELFYDQTDRFIQDYKVLTENMSAGTYRAIVQVTVRQDKIKETLTTANLIVEERVMPKVLFYLAEKKVEDILPSYWWGEDLVFVVPSSEESMAQILADEGMDIVSHAGFTEPVNYPLNVPAADAIELGKHMAADIVIIGTATAEKTTNVMDGNVMSFKGAVEVRAFRTETGKEIAFAARTAVSANENEVVGGREALFNAGMLVGQEMALQIASAWENEASLQSLVEIKIHGTSELAYFIQFRKALGKIPGVTAIHIKVMKADESIITVDYDGTAQSLADELLLKTFDNFGIDIYDVSPGNLGVELVSG